MPPRLTAYPLTPPDGGRMLAVVGRSLALRALVGISGGGDAASRTTEFEVGYTGDWAGHADGPFSLTPEDLQSCVDAFNAQANPTSSDYEHASLNPDGAPKPASVWTQRLRTDGKRLWATGEFTPRAAEMIRNGEYRYCSGVFAIAGPDRKTGKPWRCVLRSIALTNDPFLDGQKPIALTARKAPSADSDALAFGRRLNGAAAAVARIVALTARGSVRALTGGSMLAKIAKVDLLAALKEMPDDMNAAQLEALLASVAARAAALDPKTGEEAEVEEAAEMTADPEVVTPPPADEPALAADDKAKDAEVACAAAPPVAPPVADPVAMAAVEPPPPAPAEPPAVVADADAAAMIASSLVADSGMDAAECLAAYQTNKDAVIGALRGQGGAIADLSAAAAGTVSALTAQVAALSASVVALTAGQKAKDEEAAAKTAADLAAASAASIDAELSAKGILPGLAPSYKALAAKDPKSYRAFMDALPVQHVFPVGRSVALSAPAPAITDLAGIVDETSPAVVALRAMYSHKPKAEADAAVARTFGPKK